MSTGKSSIRKEAAKSLKHRKDRSSDEARPAVQVLGKTRSLSSSTGSLPDVGLLDYSAKHKAPARACSYQVAPTPVHSFLLDIFPFGSTPCLIQSRQPIIRSPKSCCHLQDNSSLRKNLYKLRSTQAEQSGVLFPKDLRKDNVRQHCVFSENNLPSKVVFHLSGHEFETSDFIDYEYKAPQKVSPYKPLVCDPTLTIDRFVGSHSQNIATYALLKDKEIDLEEVSRLNRHIGSIRRLFKGRGGGASSVDRSSPVIKLSECAEASASTLDNCWKGESERRGSNVSRELCVPEIHRSRSMSLVNEAFTAVHNLCVVPANAGKAIDETASKSSRSSSPALSSSPGTLFVASDSSVPFVSHAPPPSPLSSPLSYSKTTKHRHKSRRRSQSFDTATPDSKNSIALASDSSVPCNNNQKIFVQPSNVSKLCISSSQHCSPKLSVAVPKRKNSAIGVAIRRLKNNNITPEQFCDQVTRNDNSNTDGAGASVCRSNILDSTSSHSSSMVPLAAKSDRCNCVQSTPSLSRSIAFRDSKRLAAVSHKTSSDSVVFPATDDSIAITPGKPLVSNSSSVVSLLDSVTVLPKNNGQQANLVACGSFSSVSSGSYSNESNKFRNSTDLLETVTGTSSSDSTSTSYHNLELCIASEGLSSPSSNGENFKTLPNSNCTSLQTLQNKHKTSVQKLHSPRYAGSIHKKGSEHLVSSPRHVQRRAHHGRVKSQRSRRDRQRRNQRALLMMHGGCTKPCDAPRFNGPQTDMNSNNDSIGNNSSASSRALESFTASSRQRTGGERAGRRQSASSAAAGGLVPGVVAALGNMPVAGTMSPPLLDSPCNTPSPMSPYGSRESLLEDELEKDEVASSAIPGILGAITTSARNYLYGGSDSLFGPRELDACLPGRSITVFIATWNMNGKEPPGFLDEFCMKDHFEDVPDMFIVGTQESGAERRSWEVKLQCIIGQKHVLLHSAMLGILHLNVFVRRELIWSCSLPEDSSHSLRPGTYFKTKGAIAIAFQFFGTRFLFINSHLFAHEEKYSQRLQNIKNISHSLDLPRSFPVKHKHKDITKRFDVVFWLGDMNFRLVANRDHVLEKLSSSKLTPNLVQHLLQWDQLSCARKKGETFIDYDEGHITFAPTFKYDPGTDNYDTSVKQRVPSYTDRILFKSPRCSVTCLEYNSSLIFRTSDHKPVWGKFMVKIRPGKDDVPYNAGLFNREVFVEAVKRRRKLQQMHQKRGDLPEGGCALQ